MQFLYRLKFEYAVILIAMGAFVSAVVFATDGDLAPIQAPVNNKPIYNATQGAIEVEVSPNRATVAGTTSCELLGNPINQAFQGSSRYRANVISIEQSTDITSFEMDLTIIQNTTLQFTVHERQTDGTFKLIASKTRTNVIGDMFHSSGLFSSTVSLQAGKTYAFGTTWNTNVNYYIGGPLLPAPFATGEILGWISRNSVTIPIGNLPNLGINDSPGSGTYSMRICLPPAPGACCQPKADGSGGGCVDVF